MSGEEKTGESAASEPVSGGPESAGKKAVFSSTFDAQHERQAGDELPEFEPLTPELVEDEAIRGDFMLRWATVLLAVLMAFGRMNDTRPLVLIRSGDEMRANGFLPSGIDTFSFTNEGKPAVNVGWLFDHVVSLAWLTGGHAGLTALKTIIAALSAWLLVRISVPGVSTWWSSICALLAVVACSSDFWPLPELMSVLGMTLTMRLLFEYRLNIAKGLNWKLPLLIAIWCNFDARAWVGAGVVVAYAAGLALTNRIRKNRDATVVTGPGLGVVAVCSVLALLVNPFHINSLLSPVTTYTVEYPAMQEQRGLGSVAAATAYDGRVDYYGVLNPTALILYDHSQIAALAVLFVALITLGLSRTIRDLSLWCCLLFVFGLILLAAHELPAAAIVSAVIAGVSAQEWYRRSFNMKYTVDAQELLLSRGGRAATVLAIAAMGFLVVTSRLPGSVPLGLGFDDDTRITMDAFAQQIQSIPADAKILHTRIEQGDLLIWHGRKSFIDSRVIPFGRPSSANSVSGLHRNLRNSLMMPPESAEGITDPEEKKLKLKEIEDKQVLAMETLKEYGITHAMLRIAPPGKPDFTSLAMLQSSTSETWSLVSLGAAVAILERGKKQVPAGDDVSRGPDVRKMAFQAEDATPPGVRPLATPTTVYDRYVYRTRIATSEDKRLAQTYVQLSEVPPQSLPQVVERMAEATLAIRHLNKSLISRPGDAEAFELLFRAYRQLAMMEQILPGGQSLRRLKQVRYFQSIIACRQALIIDPDNLGAWDGLASAYQQLKRMDLCREALDNWVRVASSRSEFEIEQLAEELENRKLLASEIATQLKTADEAFAKAMEQQREQMRAATAAQPAIEPDPATPDALTTEQLLAAQIAVTEASSANAGGLPRTALTILRNNQNLIQNTPYGTMLLGQLMLEAGELNDATQVLPQLKLMAQARPADFGVVEWQLPVATLEVALCNYSGATATWMSQATEIAKQTDEPPLFSGAMFSLPLVADINFAANLPVPVWPFEHTNQLASLGFTVSEVRGEVMLLAALARIEEGDMKSARLILKSIIEDLGDGSARPLALFYYSLTVDEGDEVLKSLQSAGDEEYLFPGEKLPDPATMAPQAPPGSASPGSPPRR